MPLDWPPTCWYMIYSSSITTVHHTVLHHHSLNAFTVQLHPCIILLIHYDNPILQCNNLPGIGSGISAVLISLLLEKISSVSVKEENAITFGNAVFDWDTSPQWPYYWETLTSINGISVTYMNQSWILPQKFDTNVWTVFPSEYTYTMFNVYTLC